MSQVFDAYATYYDLLYQDKDYVAEARFVHSILESQGVKKGRLLELGCGTGKHAEQLARLGHSVHGIDLSPTMIQVANMRKPEDLDEKLVFEVGDARIVRPKGKFDAVISLFHVVSYQTTNVDLSAMFNTVSAHLNVGGIFIFDCWYGPAVLATTPTVRVKRMSGNGYQVLRVAEPVIHPNENVVDVNYQILVTQEDSQTTQNIQETHRMRYLFLPEISNIMSMSDLDLVRACEWGTGIELGFGTWCATIVARRS